MEATWQAVGAMPPSQALRLRKTHGKQQQELTGFVIAYSSELRSEVGALIHYIFLVLLEAFHRSGARFRKVKPAKIVRQWQIASELFGSITDQEAAEAMSAASQVKEPAVFSYIVDALGPEQEDPIILTNQEFGQSLSILATVVTCLHDGRKTR